MPSRLDYDHRLGPRGRTGCRHELAGIFDRFDIEHDGSGCAVRRKLVEQIAKIYIDLVADRDDGGEADPALCRPFDHSGHDRARLGDDGEIALLRHAAGEAGVQTRGWHQHAQTIWADHAQALVRAASSVAAAREPRP